MRFQQHLSEGKVRITPLLKSVFGKQDMFTKDDANNLVKVLSKIGDNKVKFDLAISLKKKSGNQYTSGKNYVIINSKDKKYTKLAAETQNALEQNGWKVTDSKKGEGKSWWIYFTRK